MKHNMKRRTTSVNRNEKKKNGRPTTYAGRKTDHQAYVASSLGATLDELGNLFSVSGHTISMWQRQYPGFRKSLKKGRYDFDSRRVVNQLLKRALGYDYVETHREYVEIDGEHLVSKRVASKRIKGKSRTMLVPGEKVRVINKHQPPSDVAIFFWLCNRSPEEWKHIQKQIVEHSGSIRNEVDLSKVPKDELYVIRDILNKAQADAKSVSGRSQNGIGVPFSQRLRGVQLASGRN